MARGRKKRQDDEDQTPAGAPPAGEMDFEKARAIYFADILPAQTGSAEHAQKASTGFKAIEKDCKIDRWAMQAVIKLSKMEASKQQHVLRSMAGLFSTFHIGLETDLVDTMEGHNSGNVIPLRPAEANPLPTMGGEDE